MEQISSPDKAYSQNGGTHMQLGEWDEALTAISHTQPTKMKRLFDPCQRNELMEEFLIVPKAREPAL